MINLDFCRDFCTQMVGSEFGSTGPSLSPGWWKRWNGVGNVFLAHYGLVITNKLLLEYHSLFKYCCGACVPTLYPSSNDYLQHHKASFHKANVISYWFPERDDEFSVLQRFSQWLHLNSVEHLWGVVELKIPAGTCTWRICRNRVMQCVQLCIVQGHCHSGTTGQLQCYNIQNILYNCLL